MVFLGLRVRTIDRGYFLLSRYSHYQPDLLTHLGTSIPVHCFLYDSLIYSDSVERAVVMGSPIVKFHYVVSSLLL